ncbi:hypothetical protein VIGAN_06124100, partial [Vigna angularis var. angularis]
IDHMWPFLPQWVQTFLLLKIPCILFVNIFQVAIGFRVTMATESTTISSINIDFQIHGDVKKLFPMIYLSGGMGSIRRR